jgi:CBS domain-containing protein
MKAREVMISPVITTKPNAAIRDVAQTMLQRRISALPVIDDTGKLVGIVSEGDLMRRVETGTERRRSWWLRLVAGEEAVAGEFVKSRAVKVADVMSTDLVTATPDTPLGEIASLFETRGIKRVPIVSKAGQLVGIVSRSNLVQALAAAPKGLEIPLSDTAIRDKLLAHLRAQPWAHTWQLNVTVREGIVDLWGLTYSDTERAAIRIAAETTPGVRAVNDRLYVRPSAELEI